MYWISSIFKKNAEILPMMAISSFYVTLFFWTKAKIQISIKQNAKEKKKDFVNIISLSELQNITLFLPP